MKTDRIDRALKTFQERKQREKEISEFDFNIEKVISDVENSFNKMQNPNKNIIEMKPLTIKNDEISLFISPFSINEKETEEANNVYDEAISIYEQLAFEYLHSVENVISNLTNDSKNIYQTNSEFPNTEFQNVFPTMIKLESFKGEDDNNKNENLEKKDNLPVINGTERSLSPSKESKLLINDLNISETDVVKFVNELPFVDITNKEPIFENENRIKESSKETVVNNRLKEEHTKDSNELMLIKEEESEESDLEDGIIQKWKKRYTIKGTANYIKGRYGKNKINASSSTKRITESHRKEKLVMDWNLHVDKMKELLKNRLRDKHIIEEEVKIDLDFDRRSMKGALVSKLLCFGAKLHLQVGKTFNSHKVNSERGKVATALEYQLWRLKSVSFVKWQLFTCFHSHFEKKNTNSYSMSCNNVIRASKLVEHFKEGIAYKDV